MSSLNEVRLIGNVGRDIELRKTTSGTSVCNFSLATNETWLDAAGNKQQKTQWHRIVIWGKAAENCKKYLGKGSRVFIRGHLQTREWTDKNSVKHQTTEVVGDGFRPVTFLDTKRSQGVEESTPVDVEMASYEEETVAPEIVEAVLSL